MTHKAYWTIGLFVILVIAATTYKVISDKIEIAEIEKDIVTERIPNKSSQQSVTKPMTDPQTPQKPLTNTPAETQNAGKQPTATTLAPNEITETEKTKNDDSVTADPVRMSPHGFGPYPEIPDGAPIATFDETDDILQELLGRVLVKVWNDGDRHIGGFLDEDTGKVYPYYENTLYVEYENEIDEETGETYVTVVSVTCSPYISKSIANSVLIGETPAGYTLVDFDKSGIDPYKFLDLP